MRDRRVVITGIATLCPLADNHEELFRKLCNGERVISKIDKSSPARKKIKSDWYVPYPDLESDGRFAEELFQIKSMGSKSAYAVSKTALSALEDSGLNHADDNASVFIGTDSLSMEELSENIISFDTSARMNVMTLPMSMQSSIASWVTIVLGTHGISSVVNMACASSTTAVGFGYESIKSGKCDMSVCGGTSMMKDKNLTFLKGFEYVKCATTDKSGTAYPFSEERSGFVFSEGGACVLILEELEHAEKRGADIYAEITGFESSSDAYGILSMPSDGAFAKNMLKRLVGDKRTDYYNAHGTATLLNDKVEADIIRSVFGDRENQPAISATKAFLGNTAGASGAFEIAVCADSIRYNKVHGNFCGTVLENLNYTPETRDIEVNCAVSASFGFGGHNSAIMLEKYRG